MPSKALPGSWVGAGATHLSFEKQTHEVMADAAANDKLDSYFCKRGRVLRNGACGAPALRLLLAVVGCPPLGGPCMMHQA